ncbi:hypothetical protein SPRG_17196 [Saprolegnia parasitica CBS 223.65]|uniref:Uncharacterized protein n=1 Tax=Saprolegnia parasitica (strain CBS 223.65) TaxID=695850 RepID=A0A067BSW1_SAPPC|nr:hypothetical protein SPRG_17196 [Saprolegnia parasitica CBS 223.65]KDO17376.1 hypothetical protein SPRG_17196 [Saprolegnia parasitica CBS 223.65]|eukprot:XP_012211920.1 hypothetical protein SPRG_17196 [Saprolegnia parasitica CBS 223.65]
MTTVSKRVSEVEDMDQTRKLTPYAAKEYADQKKKALQHLAVEQRPVLRQLHMPCRHLIRVLAFLDLRDRIIDCFHPMFLFENYKKAVAEVSYKLPLFDRAVPNRAVLAPPGQTTLKAHC